MRASIQLGIAIAHVTTMPGQTRTSEEIAAYADCDPSYIRHIEMAALRKLRRVMSRREDPVVRDLCEFMFRR